MGRATIVSGGTDGLYSVKLDYGQATKTARLAALATRLAALAPQITYAQGLLSVQQVFEAVEEAKVLSAIDAYITATRLVPPDAAAVAAALKAYTAAQVKLLPEKASTGQLRAALQLLENEKTQLTKEQTKWAALVLEETTEAWCADLTEDATGSVATLEIPGENKLVIIAPTAPAPTADDGVLTAREVQSSYQVFWNAAALPGWQKWMPTYRRGTITAIDGEADTADVTLEASDTSSAQHMVIDQTPTLAKVPVQYMTCNSSVFKVGDRCVVKFKDHDWQQPTVVGFVDHPQACVGGLSGVVKGGVVLDLGAGKKALERYRPTPNAWAVPLRKDPAKAPGTFYNEPFLAKAGTQYARLRPTMYSGLMAKAVQIIMGRGYVVDYDYRWATCHGISRGPDGKYWLLQLSADGVLAMPLPLDKGIPTASNDLVKHASLLFGGVPSGAAFPTGSKLTDAITAGTVKVMLGAAGLTDFYSKNPFASTMGWSFNDDGTEAHNTCHDADGETITSYHYKLALSFADPAAPVAVLSLVSSGLLTKKQYRVDGPFAPIPLYIWDHQLGAEVTIPQREVLYDELDVDGTAPLIACHINGALEVLTVNVTSEGSYSYVDTGADLRDVGVLPGSWTVTEISRRPGRFVTYTSQPAGEFAYEYSVGVVTAIASYTIPDDRKVTAYTGVTYGRQALDVDGFGGWVTWGRLARDCFAVFETPSTSFVVRSGSYYSVPDPNPDGVNAGFNSPQVNDPATGLPLPGFVFVSTGPGAWTAVPSGTTTSTSRPVTFHMSTGPVITLPDADNALRNSAYVDTTYSVFGSGVQQAAITSGAFYHVVGDLLPALDAEPISPSYTFIGYT